MQKTFLKFMVFELVERVLRFRLLLNECVDTLQETAPALKDALISKANDLESAILAHKSQLNRLFTEGNASAKQVPVGLEAMVEDVYSTLGSLSQTLLQLGQFNIESETYLFLKDMLPASLMKTAGEQNVLLTREKPELDAVLPLSGILFDSLSILQKGNPLAWSTLGKTYSQFLAQTASALDGIKTELQKAEKKRTKDTAGKASECLDSQVEQILIHALNLRLVGPAYYFQAVADAVLSQDEFFLSVVEPALFYGLNHQNFIHKNLVILHEACEKAREQQAPEKIFRLLSDDLLASLFRAVEKAIPSKVAFQEKHFERALQLKERLNDGILLSSTAMYPVEEVSELLHQKQAQEDFSIYEPLGMMTEYPHSPREIMNAGWLYKVERIPVWLYTALNEEDGAGFTRVLELLNYQDRLLCKSIEVSEVHRVLLCTV